jgi:hypothetical protein
MHDGYIFTLGICAGTYGLAPACLNLMLAALPPVKRAALLGEVLISASAPSLDDPLVEPIRADIADAELLLVVTPLVGGALPTRLRALAHRVKFAPPPPRPRFMVIVVVGEPNDEALLPLRRLRTAVGAVEAGELWLEDSDALGADQRRRLEDLARAAYAQARGLEPEALPR